MQIKFFNIETLDTNVVNVKHGTLNEVLNEAEKVLPNFNKTILSQKGDTLKFDGYMADIIYHGKTREESKSGRVAQDWSEKLDTFKKFYKPTVTASALSAASGLQLGHVYYIARKYNFELASARRGKRK